MTIVGEGMVTCAEIEAMLDGMLQDGALGYRKLIDATQADTEMKPEDFLPLAVRVRAMHGMGRMGPLAIALPNDKGAQAEAFIGAIAAADRPMRVFRDLAEAELWIKRQSAR